MNTLLSIVLLFIASGSLAYGLPSSRTYCGKFHWGSFALGWVTLFAIGLLSFHWSGVLWPNSN